MSQDDDEPPELVLSPTNDHGISRVTLFIDYAKSVIWFPDNLEYADTELSEGLLDSLKDWESSYYAGLGAEMRWDDLTLFQAFESQGMALARQLSDELGREFVIEYITYSGAKTTHEFKSDDDSTNKDAASAFRAKANHVRGLRERTLEWRANNLDTTTHLTTRP